MLDEEDIDLDDEMCNVNGNDDDNGLVMKSSVINSRPKFGKIFAPAAVVVSKNSATNGGDVINGRRKSPPFNVWCNGTDATDRKPRRRQSQSMNKPTTRFDEVYYLTGETLGRGAYAHVEACINRLTAEEYAVKIIDKRANHSRIRVIKEIELFHLCAGHPNIVQLIEYFEEDDKFILVFEMMRGGPLLSHIQRKICFTENEASLVVRDIANALKFLHDQGIAHRDLKPENILCTSPETVSPVKLCDLDLASKCNSNVHAVHSITTPELQSPVGSAEFMAPEVVDAFVGESLRYDKRCDLWSLGVILYIMLCGYPPFYGECDSQGECGWNQGLPCSDCQETLFAKIQLGRYDFPHQEWSGISDDAKDLITHLLEKDVNRRYGVDDVLRHPFIVNEAPKTPLQTPNILLRNDSKRDLLENFAAFERIKLHQRLSTGGCRSPTLIVGGTNGGGVSPPVALFEVPSAPTFVLRKPLPPLPPTATATASNNMINNSKTSTSATHLQRQTSGVCQAIGGFVGGLIKGQIQRPSNDGVSVKV